MRANYLKRVFIHAIFNNPSEERTQLFIVEKYGS
jgi:hypothetical protein